jgi:YVTN family beta-propeller protein
MLRTLSAKILFLASVLVCSASAAEAATYAYVANSGSNSVSVVDVQSNRVVATIGVQKSPTSLAASPNGQFVYVSSTGGDVQVIDTSTNKVSALIAAGQNPGAIAVRPDGRLIYVANNISCTKQDYISVIDTTQSKVVGQISLGQGTCSSQIAFLPDAKYAYVAIAIALGPCQLEVIDATTNSVTTQNLGVGWNPCLVAVAPDGKHAYVATGVSNGNGSNSVSVIDTASFTVVNTISLPNSPSAIAVTPHGEYFYVANGNVVSVFSTANNKLTATLTPSGGQPDAIAFTPDGNFAYIAVAGAQGNTVAVDYTPVSKIVATVAVGMAPASVVVITPPNPSSMSANSGGGPYKCITGLGENRIYCPKLSDYIPCLDPSVWETACQLKAPVPNK